MRAQVADKEIYCLYPELSIIAEAMHQCTCGSWGHQIMNYQVCYERMTGAESILALDLVVSSMHDDVRRQEQQWLSSPHRAL